VAARLRRPRRPATLGPPADHRRRLLAVLAVLALLFVVVAAKVVDLQVVSPERYLEWGQAQRVSTQTLAAERGAILDRNGDELAISRPARTVFVDPALIDEPSVAAAQVAPLLGLDVTEVTAKMAGEGRFSYLKRKVPVEVADQVEALGIAGVGLLDESERYLPAGTSARSLIGTVDTDNQGTSGLEALLGDQLTGTPGEVSLERTPTGRTIAVGEHSLEPAVAGDDVQLTIDRAIQFEAERLLGEQVSATEAKGGVAIVMVPDTGEILAMANIVRDPETGEVVTGTNNAALTTQYEPGSVMKVATIAGALEAGLVDPSTTMTLPPTLQIYDDVFQEAEPRGQRGHDQDRPAARTHQAPRHAHLVRLRPPDDGGLPERGAGRAARRRRLVGHLSAHHLHRPGRGREPAPDAHGLQRGGHRRRVRRPVAGPVHDRRRRCRASGRDR
jgi:cell division protein FtsI/penicillin-binding protein 2